MSLGSALAVIPQPLGRHTTTVKTVTLDLILRLKGIFLYVWIAKHRFLPLVFLISKNFGSYQTITSIKNVLLVSIFLIF